SQLEDVAHLDAPLQVERMAALRAWIAGADLGCVDRAVRLEVAPDHQIDDVPARSIGAGHPSRTPHNPGINEITDARFAADAEHAWSDIALDQQGMFGEVGLAERRHLGRGDLGFEALHVEVAIAWQSHRQRAARAIRIPEDYEHVLQGVLR